MSKREQFDQLVSDQKGTALFMTLMILSGIMVAALGISQLMITSLKMGGIQTQSTKAYFAAEAGTEKALWKYESDDSFHDYLGTSSKESIFGVETLDNGSEYKVDYTYSSSSPDFNYKIFTTVGDFEKVRRTVQASLKYPK